MSNDSFGRARHAHAQLRHHYTLRPPIRGRRLPGQLPIVIGYDRFRSLSIVYERFALCKDNCTQRVRGVLGAAQGGGAGGVKALVSCLFCSILSRTASVAAWMSASAAGASPTFATRRANSSRALIFHGGYREGRHHGARGHTDDGTSGTSTLGGDWAGRLIFSCWSRTA
jgi:hypothetical protein